MLDFVPNHMAPDHPWVERASGLLRRGDRGGARRRAAELPARRDAAAPGPGLRPRPVLRRLADTLQLNYGNPALQEAMLGELLRIARQCDGVRCDMAMLVLPDVFERTWGIVRAAVLARATAASAREDPGFLSWPRSTGTSSGRCSSRASTTRTTSGSTTAWRGDARRSASICCAGLDFQDRLARFLENHDEPRAAATFPPDVHRAAAVITFLRPGLRFFHQGQREGKRVRIPDAPRPRAGGAAGPGDRRVLRRPSGLPERTRHSATATGSSSSASGVGRQRDSTMLRGSHGPARATTGGSSR